MNVQALAIEDVQQGDMVLADQGYRQVVRTYKDSARRFVLSYRGGRTTRGYRGDVVRTDISTRGRELGPVFDESEDA